MKNISKEDELNLLKDQCITILDFMMSKNDNTVFLQFKNVVMETYNKKNLNGFKKYLIKDITEWASGLPKNDLDDLNVILNSKFGTTIKAIKDYN